MESILIAFWVECQLCKSFYELNLNCLRRTGGVYLGFIEMCKFNKMFQLHDARD